MKLCFNEATVMERGTLRTDIVNSAKAGFRYMEVRKEKLLSFLREGYTLEDLKELLQENSITPSCINALSGISFTKRQDRQNMKEVCEFLCYCGSRIGCRDLEVIASFDVPTEDVEEINQNTAASLKSLSKIARNYGVRLALEYMGVPRNSVKTFRQGLDIVRMVKEDNVGLLPDTWHHYAGGSKPEDFLLAKPEEIFVVHISDCPEHAPFTAVRSECLYPGDGAAPVTEDLRKLKEIGYDGVVSIEIFGPEIQGMDPKEGIPAAYRKAKEAMEKAGL